MQYENVDDQVARTFPVEETAKPQPEVVGTKDVTISPSSSPPFWILTPGRWEVCGRWVNKSFRAQFAHPFFWEDSVLGQECTGEQDAVTQTSLCTGCGGRGGRRIVGTPPPLRGKALLFSPSRQPAV